MAKQFDLSPSTLCKIARAIHMNEMGLQSMLELLERSPMSLYAQVRIPKGDIGFRNVVVPTVALKHLQRNVNDLCFRRFKHGKFYHGFVRSRSVVTNAKCHIGSTLAVSIDFSNFFTSIRGDTVFEAFQRICRTDEIAYAFTLICTVCDVLDDPAVLTNRYLPQGASTSPVLSNLCTNRCDYRIASLLTKKMPKWSYSRYADDLTFSTHDKNQDVGRLLNAIARIVSDEGFTIASHKTHVERDPNAIKVTGILVNPHLHLPRQNVRVLRSLVHKLDQFENADPQLSNRISGLLSFMASVSVSQFKEVIEKLNLHNNHRMSGTPIYRYYWSNQDPGMNKYVTGKSRMRLKRQLYRLESRPTYFSHYDLINLKSELVSWKSNYLDEYEKLMEKHRWLDKLLEYSSGVNQIELGFPCVQIRTQKRPRHGLIRKVRVHFRTPIEKVPHQPIEDILLPSVYVNVSELLRDIKVDDQTDEV